MLQFDHQGGQGGQDQSGTESYQDQQEEKKAGRHSQRPQPEPTQPDMSPH